MTVRSCCHVRLVSVLLLTLACICLPPSVGAAQEEESSVAAHPPITGDDSVGTGIRILGVTIAAALAIGLAGLGTARVQAAVGAGGTGALAEKPELFASILVLYAIPETIVVLGFVIAILIAILSGVGLGALMETTLIERVMDNIARARRDGLLDEIGEGRDE